MGFFGFAAGCFSLVFVEEKTLMHMSQAEN
jgi:hypothetical protein